MDDTNGTVGGAVEALINNEKLIYLECKINIISIRSIGFIVYQYI